MLYSRSTGKNNYQMDSYFKELKSKLAQIWDTLYYL